MRTYPTPAEAINAENSYQTLENPQYETGTFFGVHDGVRDDFGYLSPYLKWSQAENLAEDYPHLIVFQIFKYNIDPDMGKS